jgi:hypothetical protein
VERDSTLLVKWPTGAGEDGAPARPLCSAPRPVCLLLQTYLGHGPSKGAPWVGRTTVWHVRASACASACLRAAPQPLCYHRATRLGSEATAPVSRLGSETTALVSHSASRTAEELLVDTHLLRRLRARATQSSCQPKAPLWTAHDQGMYVVKGGRRGRGALHRDAPARRPRPRPSATAQAGCHRAPQIAFLERPPYALPACTAGALICRQVPLEARACARDGRHAQAPSDAARWPGLWRSGRVARSSSRHAPMRAGRALVRALTPSHHPDATHPLVRA